MENNTIQEKILKIFDEDAVDITFEPHKDGECQMIIGTYIDPVGDHDYRFEYYSNIEPIDKIVLELLNIDIDYQVSNEVAIRTDPDYYGCDIELSDDSRAEIKDVCEKWGETLRYVVEKIVEGLAENKELIKLKDDEYTVTKDETGTEMDAPGYELLFVSCAADNNEGQEKIVDTINHLNNLDISFQEQSVLKIFGATHYVEVEPEPNMFGDKYYFRHKQ